MLVGFFGLILGQVVGFHAHRLVGFLFSGTSEIGDILLTDSGESSGIDGISSPDPVVKSESDCFSLSQVSGLVRVFFPLAVFTLQLGHALKRNLVLLFC